MTASRPDHSDLAEALRYRVLEGPGVSDRATRKAAAERASGGQAIAASYDDLVRQIGELSHRVTTPQVERLVSEVGSEKAAFEVIVAAAMSAGLLRWRSAIKVLDGVSDASAGN
jgi:chorismate synthase